MAGVSQSLMLSLSMVVITYRDRGRRPGPDRLLCAALARLDVFAGDRGPDLEHRAASRTPWTASRAVGPSRHAALVTHTGWAGML
jgi:hypothetical protein